MQCQVLKSVYLIRSFPSGSHGPWYHTFVWVRVYLHTVKLFCTGNRDIICNLAILESRQQVNIYKLYETFLIHLRKKVVFSYNYLLRLFNAVNLKASV